MTREEQQKMSDEAVDILSEYNMVLSPNIEVPFDNTFTINLYGWKFKIFMDAGSVDYTEELTAPDGRFMNFDDMNENEMPTLDPLDCLAHKDIDIYNDLIDLLEGNA